MKNILFMISVCVIIAIFIGSKITAQTLNDNVLIILDLSKSMNEQLNSQETKIDVAKKAVKEVIKSLPSNVNLGLRVYGHKNGLLGMNQCHKTDLIAPIAPNNQQKILNEINKLNPSGVTLIEYSMKKGIDDLKDLEGNKRIILISDGLETCGGDPCSFARKLKKSGQDIKVDVVSFGRNINNFSLDSQLQCIALATSGTFSRADTQIDLVNAINNAVRVNKQVYWSIKPNY